MKHNEDCHLGDNAEDCPACQDPLGEGSGASPCSALRIPTRPRCHRCQRYITIDTHADDDLWEEVIGERFGPGYICADCFTRAADERLIEWEGRLKLVPISLAAQMKIQARVSSQNVKAESRQPGASAD